MNFSNKELSRIYNCVPFYRKPSLWFLLKAREIKPQKEWLPSWYKKEVYNRVGEFFFEGFKKKVDMSTVKINRVIYLALRAISDEDFDKVVGASKKYSKWMLSLLRIPALLEVNPVKQNRRDKKKTIALIKGLFEEYAN